MTRKLKLSFCLEIVTKKACLFEVQILDHKHILSKKQTCFRFLQQVAPVSISFSFPRMVENGGTGSSSTGKSLLEALHEAGGGKEASEAQNKITESDATYGKGMTWNEVFARNSVGLGFKSMCRDDTDILMSAMMIPGGILLVATLCIIMPLHQLALTVFLPRRPCPSSPV
jgi:hypothetical protein